MTTSTMSLRPDMQIYNPKYEESPSDFRYFPQLPTEIRLEIWRLALQRQRIIRITLEHNDEAPEDNEATGECERYCLYAVGFHMMSKFMRVTSESRQAAMEFYRVHLPCRLSTQPIRRQAIDQSETKLGTLYFNPEYDFLDIMSGGSAADDNYLVDFLRDLKTTYDPRHIGLLNLVIDANELVFLEDATLESDASSNAVFLETIKQLRAVWFLHETRIGRMNFGIHSEDTSYYMSAKVFHNRSYPIMPLSPTFECIPRDPRPITQDLQRVHLFSFSVTRTQAWPRLLEEWGVSQAQTEYRHLLTFVPDDVDYELCDRASATRWVEGEEEKWRNPPGSLEYQQEDLDNIVKPAFGFWLFPLTATATLEGTTPNQPLLNMTTQSPGTLRDLTGHWPELALSSLN